MRTFLTLLLITTLACNPAATESRVGPPIDPVYLTSSSKLASDSEQTKIDAAIYSMNKDPTLEVTLFGYTEPGKSASATLSASEKRAAAVRDLLVAGGVDKKRVVVKGMGAPASGTPEEQRRVELVFSEGEGSAATTAAAPPPGSGESTASNAKTESSASSSKASSGSTSASAATASADEGASTKKEKESTKSSAKASKSEEPAERKSIESIGITDLDSFFGKVQTLLTRLWTIQDSLAKARTSLLTIIGVAQDASLDTALADAIAAVKGSVQLTMVGTSPKLKLVASGDKKAGQVVTAVNGLVDAVIKSATELPKLKNDAMALVAEAQSLPARVPSIVAQAGLKPTDIPRVAKVVKGNVGVTASIPKEVDRVLDEGVETFNAIKGAFG